MEPPEERDPPPVAPIRDQLQEALGASYVIEREIGGGGMSRVFIADERALGRRIVIKVLSPELASAISGERFQREIRLAASLQQANIVPLLAAGAAAGLPYYTMPLVEGRSLRDRLDRDGMLPISEGLGILRDLARALAYAHARGVVHRDIKPGNILLSGRTAVVTDFGIAKALGEARGGEMQSALTGTGTSIGTPAYMSPEQATGDPSTDHRADVYSFGCVAYEVFTGRPPFHGRAAHEIIAAHLTAPAPPVAAARPEVPQALADLIARCLEKQPDQRPQTAEELLATLDATTGEGPASRRPRRRRAVLGSGIVLALVAAGAVAYARYHATPEPLTLSAIPFLNLAHDTTLDYLSDGISDELLTGLQQLPGVRILNRQMAYRYRGRGDIDVRTVAHDLGVQFLVTGSMRDANGQLTISAQLNDGATGGELWTKTSVVARDNVGAATDGIVRTLSDTLRARFPAYFRQLPRSPAGTGTTNGAALDLYLVGQEQLKRRAIRPSVTSFERAIAMDPRFARAHAALAVALTFFPYYLGVSPHDVQDSTIAEARRALGYDSTLADAYTALGATYGHISQWDSSDANFGRAVALEPDNFEALHTWSRFLIIEGRANEALRHLERARSVERTSALVSAWRAYAFFFDGQSDSALAEVARARQIDSTNLAVDNLAAAIYLALGRNEEARRMMVVMPPPQFMSTAPYLFTRLGDTATANALVRSMDALSPRPWFADAEHASIFLATGDTARALTALERSEVGSGPMWATGPIPAIDPAFDPVRQSPRFTALLRRARLNVGALSSLRRRR